MVHPGTGLVSYLHMAQFPCWSAEHSSRIPPDSSSSSPRRAKTLTSSTFRSGSLTKTLSPPPRLRPGSVSKEPLHTIIHSRRSVSRAPPITYARSRYPRAAPCITHNRGSVSRPSTQHPDSPGQYQDPLSINSQRLSVEDCLRPSAITRASIQDPLSVTYSRQFHTRDAPPCFQSRLFSNQNPLLTTRTPLTNIRSVTCHSQLSVQSPKLSLQTSMSPVRASRVPLSITHSPEASIKVSSQLSGPPRRPIRDSLSSLQTSQSILEIAAQNLPSASFENNAGR